MTEEQKHAYIVGLRALGLEAKAARALGITMASVRKEIDTDPDFAEQVQESLDLAADRFEEEAIRRAVEGTEKGVYFQGSLVDTETVYSDTLLVKVLQARRPDKYGNKTELTGAAGGPLEFIVRDFNAPLA